MARAGDRQPIITVAPISACVLTMTPTIVEETLPEQTEDLSPIGGADGPTSVLVAGPSIGIYAAGGLAILAAAAFLFLRKGKK